MASGLPREIYIKQRKRRRDEEDDAPTYLQLDNDDPSSKRRMSGNVVWQRRNVKDEALFASPSLSHTPPTPLAPPVIKTKEPISKKTPIKAPVNDSIASAPDAAKDASPPPPAAGLQPSARPTFQPRRFHMSRSLMKAKGNQSPKIGPQGVGKKRYATAVFVERGARRLQQLDPESIPDTTGRKPDIAMSDSSTRKKPSARRIKPSVKPEDTKAQDPTTSAQAATPGAAAAASAPAVAAAAASAAPPSSAAPTFDQRKPLPNIAPTTDPNDLADEMDKWVLHEIGVNLKEINQSPTSTPSKMKTSSKFKPRAPAQRFADRNPELAARLDAQDGTHAGDTAMQDADADLSDDDYEIVVYELAPNEGPNALRAIPPEQIGVLKFDSREDMELFYGNEDDDSDWMPEDDEDENAENHYTAEYPEELDSDDSEFDGAAAHGTRLPRGPYDDDDDDDGVAAYYHSGTREFDGDYDAADDDDEGDNIRYIVEGDDESRDRDEVFQERIRRYIKRYGGN